MRSVTKQQIILLFVTAEVTWLRMELSFCHGRLSVACALSIVVLLSVALGRTVPDSLVRTTPGPSLKITEDIVHVDPPVESPVVSENLVAGVPVIVATCNNPLIRGK